MANVSYTLTKWNYEEFNKFATAFGAGDLETSLELVGIIVDDWSAFDYIPAKTEHPEEELTFEDGVALCQMVKVTSNEYVAELDLSDVIVDMSKWKAKDYTRFRKLSGKSDNLDEIFSLIGMVARLKGKNGSFNTAKELNALQGMAIVKAVTEKMSKVWQGGN